MAQRKQKRKISYRGLRTHGAGNVKNRRGSGNRGGRGNAGLCKHKFSWMVNNAPDHFGKHGFVRPMHTCISIVNLFDINRKATMNLLEKKNDKFYFEFRGKVLGTGELLFPVVIKALGWSKNTEEKVKKHGGEMIKLEGAGKKEERRVN